MLLVVPLSGEGSLERFASSSNSTPHSLPQHEPNRCFQRARSYRSTVNSQSNTTPFLDTPTKKIWKARQAMLAGASSGESKTTGESGEGARGGGSAATTAMAARSRSGTGPENKDDSSKEKEKASGATLDKTGK